MAYSTIARAERQDSEETAPAPVSRSGAIRSEEDDDVPLVRYVDEARAPKIVRDIFEALRKSQGKVQNSRRVLAHNPDVLRAFGPFLGAITKENALTNRLKELAIVKASLINGCRY